jgi:hypothetical protein
MRPWALPSRFHPLAKLVNFRRPPPLEHLSILGCLVRYLLGALQGQLLHAMRPLLVADTREP